jgi:uncharacterized repeat protein (TIGR01451 family)
MKKESPTTTLWRVGTLCLLLIALTPLLPLAQPTGTTTTLYSNIGDGFAQFSVNEFGSFRGCGGPGLVFDPLGAFGPKQTDCYTSLYLSDTVGNRRTPIADNDWPYYNNCLPTGTEVPPTAAGNVTSDVTVGTHTRITQFTLPAFPELQVQLTQVVCGHKLVQTYAITNTSVSTLYLRLTRSGDIDIEYTAPFFQNYGAEYPVGSSNPIGGIVLDNSTNFGVAFTAPATGNAVFEGWRIQVGVGSFGHSATWGNYGYLPTPYPGINGDGLNGMWSNPGGFNVNGICGVTATDVPLAANFAAYYGVLPARDMNLIIQSKLVIPGGTTRTYVTETVAEPGANCCQGPNCGTLSGNVSVDAGGCTPGAPLANQIVIATETTTLLSYYGLTDASGNYMINAPYGTYTVSLAIGTNLSLSCPPLPSYTLNPVTQSIVGINLLTEDICAADLFIVGSYPANDTPAGCGLPPRTPCPGNDFRYCFSVLNTGTSAIPAGTNFIFMPDTSFTVTSVSQAGSCWTFAPNPFTPATLNNTLPSGGLCSFCVDVSIPAASTPPWYTLFLGDAGAVCVNTDPLLDSEVQTDTAACSCDPNQKWAYPSGCGPNHVIGDVDITYNIEFDNIGTTPAGRVVVIDQLDMGLDLASFRILQTSYPLSDARIHPVVGQPGQYEVHFIFDNINLPPIALDRNAIGRIIYRISPKSGLADGTRIENYATIYFDDNLPIQTNTVFHTFRAQPSPIVNLGSDQTLYLGYGAVCATLAPTVTGGSAPYTYLWSTGATTSTLQVCPTTTTTYSITVTDAEGCSSVGSVTVHVVDARCGNNLSKVVLCHNGHEICVSPSAVASHLANGDVLGPCTGSAKTATVAAPMVAGMRLEVFPNPASSMTQVRFVMPQDGDVSVELYSMDGKRVSVVWSGFVVGELPQTISVDLSAVEAGIYALRMASRQGQMTKRLVVTH